MSFDQILLCWSLMAIQGIRRLFESFVLSRPSQSTMWFGHWLLGILFYLAMGISIWIEGIGDLKSTNSSTFDVKLLVPSLRTMIFLWIFIKASGTQHAAHAHLASLKKYSLPSHQAFETIICPHYTAECALYLALAFLGAPQGQLLNGTMLSGLIFVVVNLGVSADLSRQWAIETFGREKVGAKWRMLPGIW